MGSIRYESLLKLGKLHRLGGDFLGVFYPRCCIECGGQLLPDSKLLCHVCLTDLPRCGFTEQSGNRAEELFYGRARIEAATSYLYFKKHGIVQNLMHQLKYKGRQDIGNWVGEALGMEIEGSDRFDSIDLVIPVPLHPKKRRKRGYNQVSRFGQVLADHLGVHFDEESRKRRLTGKSLTGKNRFERNASIHNAFYLANPELVKGRHILLVDDIITSGATLEACAQKILNLPDTRISLASMAFSL